MIEELLTDLTKSDCRWTIGLLRYFNPVGAHISGLLGEDPNGVPNNLLPYVSQVAIGKLPKLAVFGGDYPTHDGTGIRDYIHVVDLSEGHLKALQAISRKSGISIWNLGTGTGYSVLEMIRAFEKASETSIPYQIVDRRSGDVAQCWADPTKAELELGWKTKRGLHEMMADTWRWQSQNPQGYSTKP
ncbi:UDP-glucose 4-epimerase [compost metagenome]